MNQLATDDIESIVVLFSGGTDSTCAAALMAERNQEVHLLTFYETATAESPVPRSNLKALQEKYPNVRFFHQRISVDRLVRVLSYENYFKNLWRFGWLMLATPGFSSLSWHLRTIIYCQKNGIKRVADGLTRELMHFPGHMDETIDVFRDLYASYGIEYTNPVRDWVTPPDQQFLDRMVVNSHAKEFFLGDVDTIGRKTTGRYLYEQGILPAPNVKGSRLDFSMQHECYPFALYNVLAFWGILTFQSYSVFCHRIANLILARIDFIKPMLEEYLVNPRLGRMSAWIEDA